VAWQTAAFARLATPLVDQVGQDTAKAFRALNCETLGDLLRLLPRHLMSGTAVTDIAALLKENRGREEFVALMARVQKSEPKGDPPRQRLEVSLTDGRTGLTATFFGEKHLPYWKGMLKESNRGIFAGKLTVFKGRPQLANPAFVIVTPDGLVGSKKNRGIAQRVATSGFIGLYPQTAKLPTWSVAEAIELGLSAIAGIEDPLPAWVRAAADLPELETAFRAVHTPPSEEQFQAGKRRLLFDEAFAAQVAMAYRREDAATHSATPRPPRRGGLVDTFLARLPFTLTGEQTAVIAEVRGELAGTRPMQRLLQGEVGSGKTVVALTAMLAVADAGGQAVLMAPTEVLAQQHAYTVAALLGDLAAGGLLTGGVGTQIQLLTGSMPASAKGEALARIAQGDAGIVIGTHALLSRGVHFHDLGLVVVDEQHRFGVEQRTALIDQGSARPHVLVMTATPIPRSVAMTHFGDLDVSTLVHVPQGRAPVTTTVVDTVERPAWVERAWARVREEVAQGRQAYIVAPRIEKGDDGTSVIELAARLAAGPLAGLRLGLLHGRLPASEKTDVMERFTAHDLDVLVATSMIEVGLDQPRASMMVICDAERFGISQLHQLRGRIGRGAHPGVCLLLTAAEPGTPARERLDTVAATRDGFALALTDLAQRREGDVLGMSQAGRRSSLRLLKVLEHTDIIDLARQIAQDVVRRDPKLTDPGVQDYVADIEGRAAIDLDEVT